MAGQHFKGDEPDQKADEAGRHGKPDKAGKPGKKGKSGKKRHSASRIISTILIIVGVALLLVAGGMWLHAQWQYHQQDVENEKLAAYAKVSDDGSTAPVVDWDALKAINDDVVGWIQIPGTVINYPVYQGEDNNHYLRHNAEGDYAIGGQVFMDYQNTAPGMVDAQTIIYGHHLNNGAMFKQVADMDDQEFFDSITTVWYVTETDTYELEPLLVYYTDPEDTNVRTFNFADEDAFHAYLMDLLDKSQTSRSDAAEIIGGTSHVLTLSTCNYIDGYGRTILVCVPKDEAEAATSS
jgi:sortase B